MGVGNLQFGNSSAPTMPGSPMAGTSGQPKPFSGFDAPYASASPAAGTPSGIPGGSYPVLGSGPPITNSQPSYSQPAHPMMGPGGPGPSPGGGPPITPPITPGHPITPGLAYGPGGLWRTPTPGNPAPSNLSNQQGMRAPPPGSTFGRAPAPTPGQIPPNAPWSSTQPVNAGGGNSALAQILSRMGGGVG